MEETGQVRTIKHGAVEIRFEGGSGQFDVAVIQAVPDFGILLTLNWDETWALFKVCEYVFETPDKLEAQYISNHLWAKTKFHFMAPLVDRKDLFWFSYGPVNCYAPRERMLVVFEDLRAAFDLLGGEERFMPDTHN